jgi:hypothetical protein
MRYEEERRWKGIGRGKEETCQWSECYSFIDIVAIDLSPQHNPFLFVGKVDFE